VTNYSIEIPFALNVLIWSASSAANEKWVECPECAGTKVIEMVKGNGEHVSLDCALCGPGYDQPRGVIRQYIHDYRPMPFMPRRVRVDGADFMYSEAAPEASCYSSIDSKHLFATAEECQAKCDALNAERTKADAESLVHQIKSKRKSMAHSASYWQGQIRDYEKKLAQAKALLSRCKQPKATVAN
jgi:hypothetical protein